MSFEAGAYRLKITPAGPGATEFDAGSTEAGFELSIERLGDPISIDELGKTVVDGIEGGVAVECELVSMEYSERLMAAILYPYASAPDGSDCSHIGLGTPGALWSTTAFKAVVESIRKPGRRYTFWKCRCMEPVDQLLSGSKPGRSRSDSWSFRIAYRRPARSL
jgi:hypothetical protein